MVEPGRGTAPARLGTVRKRWPLVVIGCCLVLGGTTPASAALPGARTASMGPISGRYQTILCDTAPWSSSARVPGDANTALAAAGLVFSASGDRFRSRETRMAITRYQLRTVISDNRWIVSNQIPFTTVRSTAGTCVNNGNRISPASSSKTASTGTTDARRLFQLAVGLAAVYVLFLAAWFWGTRERRSRVGSAARS